MGFEKITSKTPQDEILGDSGSIQEEVVPKAKGFMRSKTSEPMRRAAEGVRQYVRRINRLRHGSITLDKGGVFYGSRFEDKIELHINEGFTPAIWETALSAVAQIAQEDESIQVIQITSPLV